MILDIGIDLDGTLVNSPEMVLEFINERLPVNLTIEDITSYCIEDALPEQYKWIVNTAFKSPEMWKKVGFYEGAQEAVNQLYHDDHRLWFTTSSLPQNLRKKINHLARNIEVPNDYVESHTINIQKKQLLRFDVMIDDALYQLTGDRTYNSICMDKPYNQTDVYIPDFWRVTNWKQAYTVINAIARHKDYVATP